MKPQWEKNQTDMNLKNSFSASTLKYEDMYLCADQ